MTNSNCYLLVYVYTIIVQFLNFEWNEKNLKYTVAKFIQKFQKSESHKLTER